LIDDNNRSHWNGRGHFFGAAAEAMRRILVESARRRKSARRGGDRIRIELDPVDSAVSEPRHDLLSLDEALEKLNQQDHEAAELVKLRYFASLTIPQAAEVLGISPRKADFVWSFARAWLRREIADQ